MTKQQLESYLDEGLSLEGIGQRVGLHPSTVSYHLKKHGLVAVNHHRNAPRGCQVSRARLKELLEDQASLRDIAEELDVSVSTARYWLKKHRLEPSRVGRARAESAAARAAGVKRTRMHCPHHGRTQFVLESRGYYRCLKCRTRAVSERRRRVKLRLVEWAGGACAICGYDRYVGALQFHHLDPTTKSFAINRNGTTRSFEELRAEARKCALLCANCHAEVEGGVSSVAAAATVSTSGRG